MLYGWTTQRNNYHYIYTHIALPPGRMLPENRLQTVFGKGLKKNNLSEIFIIYCRFFNSISSTLRSWFGAYRCNNNNDIFSLTNCTASTDPTVHLVAVLAERITNFLVVKTWLTDTEWGWKGLRPNATRPPGLPANVNVGRIIKMYFAWKYLRYSDAIVKCAYLCIE